MDSSKHISFKHLHIIHRSLPLWDAGDAAGPSPEADREELMLFEDHDDLRGLGNGYFSGDETERTSRRVDLRGPLDFDPGPIEMEEAPPELEAIELSFR